MRSRLGTRAGAAIVALLFTVSVPMSWSSAAASGSPTLGVSIGGFDDPAGMALDQQGTLWVANNQAGSVQSLPQGDVLQSQLPAATTGLSYPADVAVDAEGNVFTSEQGSTTVLEIPSGGGPSQTFAGFHQPAQVVVDANDDIWVANSAADTIQEIPAGATAATILPAPIGGLNHPNGIAIDAGGNLWVANTGGATIQEIPAGSTSGSTLPPPVGGFDQPYAIAIDRVGNLWVTNQADNSVQEVPAGATFKTTLASPITGFDEPTDITLGPDDDLWVSNTGGTTIQQVPEDATSLSTLPAPISGFNGPFGVVFTSSCSAWVSNVGQGFNGSGLTIQQVDAPLGCPSAPSSPSATPGNGQALVTWAASSASTSYPVSAYSVASMPGGYTCSTGGASLTSCVVTGLTNGVAYRFDVVAENALGDSGPALSAAVTPSASILDAPTLVSDSSGNATATVTWSAPSASSPILYYLVSLTATGVSPQGAILLPSATTATFTSLANGAAYTFSVVAVDASGDGNPLTVALTPVTTPGPVRSVAATGERHELLVVWSPPPSTGGAAITGYEVFVGTSPSTIAVLPSDVKSVPAGTTRYIVHGLLRGSRYFVVVRALNHVGTGAASRMVSALVH